MRINKSSGLNESEHRLVKLGERFFMSLWSYPNPKIKTSSGTPELCDLLVICGNNVLIFSDKNIKFNENKDLLVAWRRWERESILEPIDSLRHAANIIRDHPDTIVLNNKEPFPLVLPAKEYLKIHLICVANGIAEIRKKYYSDNCLKGLMFSNINYPLRLLDIDCMNLSKEERRNYQDNVIFKVTDYDINKNFVHVFDGYTLPLVLSELDTLIDFIEYLDNKENLIRNHNVEYSSETDILLRYLSCNKENSHKHDFLQPEENSYTNIKFSEVNWDRFKCSNKYTARKFLNKESYLWDDLVQHLCKGIIDGSSKNMGGSEDFDIALRYMAMEPRIPRRIFARQLGCAIERGYFPSQTSVYKTMFMSSIEPSLMYVFLQVPKISSMAYDDYLNYRRRLMRIMANCIKSKSVADGDRGRYTSKIVCIATEPLQGKNYNSTDYAYYSFENWNEKNQQEWEQYRYKIGWKNFSVNMQPLLENEWMGTTKIVNKEDKVKIGPNAPCPCRSGKKYKKCCGKVRRVMKVK